MKLFVWGCGLKVFFDFVVCIVEEVGCVGMGICEVFGNVEDVVVWLCW